MHTIVRSGEINPARIPSTGKKPDQN